MAQAKGLWASLHRSRDWLAAWRATWNTPVYNLQNALEPRFTGRAERAADLMAGRFSIAGQIVHGPSIWDITAKDISARNWAHGFEWIADLAADGTGAARDMAQTWLDDWTLRFGRGGGPGWRAALTGRRLIHLIMQCEFLSPGQSHAQNTAMRRLWVAHGRFLTARGAATQNPIARVENAVALALLPILLDMPAASQNPATVISPIICDLVDDAGKIPSRNPAQLLYLLELSLMARDILAWHDLPCPEGLQSRIHKMANHLRQMRLSSGHLPRMHASGRGNFGRLDHALDRAKAPVSPQPNAMGFHRLSAGRSTVVIDAGLPPKPHSSASLLGIEFSSGRDMILAPPQNGASIARQAKSILAGPDQFCTISLNHPHRLHIPSYIPAQQEQDREGLHFEGAHDGWATSSGLTHLRQLDLAASGLALHGEDQLLCLNKDGHDRFAALESNGVDFSIHFHIHPACIVTQQANAARIKTASGQIWVFDYDGPVDLQIHDTMWQDASHLVGRSNHCIALQGRATTAVTRVQWQIKRNPKMP
jgi:uncharacterized heparinase superfamily protein